MSYIEGIIIGTMAIVFTYFHCVCWKNCSFTRRKPHVRGSFIISKEEKNDKRNKK